MSKNGIDTELIQKFKNKKQQERDIKIKQSCDNIFAAYDACSKELMTQIEREKSSILKTTIFTASIPLDEGDELSFYNHCKSEPKNTKFYNRTPNGHSNPWYIYAKPTQVVQFVGVLPTHDKDPYIEISVQPKPTQQNKSGWLW